MIRPAQQCDVSRIVQIFGSAIGGNQDPGQISQWVDGPHSAVLVDISESAIRGAIAGQVVEEEAEIYDLAVATEHRRRGIGAGLVRAFIEACREDNVTDIFLEVRQSNLPAINLYSGLGFSHRGERPGYYSDGESALMLGWAKQ